MASDDECMDWDEFRDRTFEWRAENGDGEWQKYQAKVSYRYEAETVENLEAKLLNAKGNLVGRMKGSILERPDRNFWYIADSVSQELCEVTSLFCDGDGYATKMQHPALLNDRATVKGGGFFHIYTLEIAPELRRQSLGIRFLCEVLTITEDLWTLAVAVPTTLNSSYRCWKGNAHTSTIEAMQRVFKRVGFVQGGDSTAGAPESFMYKGPDCFFLTKALQKLEPENWLTKEQVCQP